MNNDNTESDQDQSAETPSTMSNISVDDQQLVTKLSGDKAQQVLQSLSNEPEYSQLKEHVVERGEELHPEEATIIRVDSENKAVLADVPISGTSADKSYLCIGRDEETDKITTATLEYDENKSDNNTIVRTKFDATSGKSSLEKEVQTINAGN